jgi:hypothetical protein
MRAVKDRPATPSGKIFELGNKGYQSALVGTGRVSAGSGLGIQRREIVGSEESILTEEERHGSDCSKND